MRLFIPPKKSLGQHFLINPRVLDKIVAAAEITKEDTVLEVGPGTGNLTKKLAEKAGRVIAVEKDYRLIDKLKKEIGGFKNVEVVEGDILKFKIQILNFKNDKYKIVANIPYYITSRFLKIIFEDWSRPKLIVLTIQKEVAQRIVAKSPKMNLLAVSVQFFAEPKIIGYIPKENFRPRPKVDSAIIRLDMRLGVQPPKQIRQFFKIVRAGFSKKRKFLINNLEELGIEKKNLSENFKNLKINKKSRAENLSLENWIKLSNKLKLD